MFTYCKNHRKQNKILFMHVRGTESHIEHYDSINNNTVQITYWH